MNLVWFSPVAWRSYPQRPHFMARALLEQGVERIFWIEPYPTRFPRLSDLRRTRTLHDQQTPLRPEVQLLQPSAIPAEPWPLVPTLNRYLFWNDLLHEISVTSSAPIVVGIGKPSSLAVLALHRLPAKASFYDAMDDFPEFYQGRSRLRMSKNEAIIAEKVDRLIVSSTGLQTKFAQCGHSLHLIHNGCDASRFPDWQPSGTRAPHFGYIGAIAEWFDWERVFSLARDLPGIHISLVGPVFSPPPADLPGNIRLHPACDQETAITHLQTFTLGLLPFRKTPLTSRVDPIKYYEYASMGIPVLSTRFGEMAWYGESDGVYFFEDFPDTGKLVSRIGSYLPRKAKIDVFRQQVDWRQRFAGLLDLIVD